MSTEHAMSRPSGSGHQAGQEAGQATEQQHGLSGKGLKAGSVGLVGAVVIGISCIAPACPGAS